MHINAGEVWQQRKGKVRLRIVSCCQKKCYMLAGPTRANHAHVVGWRTDTMVATNHSIIPIPKLRKNYELVT